MDSKEQVQKLIRGSENIDRMKREVVLVVSTLISFLSTELSNRNSDIPVSFRNKEESLSFNNFGYRWDIQITRNWRLYVVYSALGGTRRYELEEGCAPTFYGSISSVKATHEGLRILVAGLMQFEAMRQHLQPFLDAADYKF